MYLKLDAQLLQGNGSTNSVATIVYTIMDAGSWTNSHVVLTFAPLCHAESLVLKVILGIVQTLHLL